MASIAKRKQQVNQLRKAHFPLGFQNNKGLTSEYSQHYSQHPISAPQSYGNRNSHFTIASDQPNMAVNKYQSEFKEKYPQHLVSDNRPVKRKNDENNIVLGFGNQANPTNYKDQYAQKTCQPVKPVNQRVVNVDLGDTLTDFTSSYHKAYDGTQGSRRQKINSNTGNNVILGYDQNLYTSSSVATHNYKSIPTGKGPSRNYETNILLGADNNQFDSQHRTQFSHKNSANQSVDKNRVLDFKSSHFKFGFPEQSAEPDLSQAQFHYSQKPLTLTVVQGAKPTNIQLKHDGKSYFESSYAQEFQSKKAEKVQLLNKNGRNNNVIIGLGTEVYNSEAKDQYVAKTIDRVKGQANEATLNLGNGDREFKTQYQDNFGNKFNDRQSNRVGKDHIQKMRAQNFVKGFSKPDYQIHSQSYGLQLGEGNKLPREVIDKMRGTNIVNSDNNVFYGTTSHNNSYSWKRNDDF